MVTINCTDDLEPVVVVISIDNISSFLLCVVIGAHSLSCHRMFLRCDVGLLLTCPGRKETYLCPFLLSNLLPYSSNNQANQQIDSIPTIISGTWSQQRF
ncbi:hypothetical protein M501DRAFT_981345 [Patellaria atrata CBS 101060]|uniref:Uncharacterized protein n=1 Tax=Patellaria atrata CBS 101060 TaxID=1346257 RepID=A0A9P4S489_9PEZI|nr:hypothetical protein M501DRAFT_981345 [Patellaria atrata CBS 101060]